MTFTKNRRSASTLFGLALALASCSSSADTAPSVEADASTTLAPGTEAGASEGADQDVEELATVRYEPRPGDHREFRSSAMGGVAFDVADGDFVLIAADSIDVSFRPIAEDGPTAAVGLVSQFADGRQLSTVAEFIEGALSVEETTFEPTGESLSLLGYELTGYRTTGPVSSGFANLFVSERFGAPIQSAFAPFPFAVVYLAETPSGVLVAHMVAFDEPDLVELEPVFGTLVESIRFTGPGLDPALPPGEPLAGEPEGEPGPPASVPDDAPPLLGAPFSPLEPGAYFVDNFGMPLVVDVPEGWSVQPNFPGFVVLTETGSIGPGDRDLVFVHDIVGVVATAGPVAAGEVVDIASVEDFLDNVPDGVTVSGRDDLVIDGVDVVRFDLGVDTDASCSRDDPCEVTFVTSYGAQKATQSTQRHRIWWIEDHPSGPAMIVAMDRPADGFIEAASEVVESGRFVSS